MRHDLTSRVPWWGRVRPTRCTTSCRCATTITEWRTTRHAAEDALGTPGHYNQTHRGGQKGDVALIIIATCELPTSRSETLLAPPPSPGIVRLARSGLTAPIDRRIIRIRGYS